MTDASDILVIGIGNDQRGDDAAGLAVARALAADPGLAARVVEHDGEVAGLVELLGGARAAVLADAAVSGGEPGTVQRLDATAGPLPKTMFTWSTHALGLAEAVELARALGRLPALCWVYAVEARGFEHGDPMDPAVAHGVEAAAHQIRADLAQIDGGVTEARPDA